jgi:hypothetical protein
MNYEIVDQNKKKQIVYVNTETSIQLRRMEAQGKTKGKEKPP